MATEPTTPTREERLAERAAERAHRLANPQSAAYERFLNQHEIERFHATTEAGTMFVSKDEQVESRTFWDGEKAR